MIISVGRYFGEPAALVCDAQCTKAWGINNRPRLQLDPHDEDDIVYLADSEAGEAPADPGTYEGGQGKPASPQHNKWCWRECERSSMFPALPEDRGRTVPLVPPDFSQRVYNQPWKHGGDIVTEPNNAQTAHDAPTRTPDA